MFVKKLSVTSKDFDEPKLRSGISESEYPSLDLVFDYLIKLNRPEVGVSYLRRNQSLKGLRSTEG
jgi:hypothetical protein